MTGKQIEAILLQHITGRGHLAIARFKRHWFFETDVLAVSKSLVTTEYEIKVTRADFLKETQKEGKYGFLSGQRAPRKGIPHRFFYAVPEGLISPDEIPGYAGLIYVSESGKLTQIRKPAWIHRQKPDTELVWDLATLACQRAAFDGITAFTHRGRDLARRNASRSDDASEEYSGSGKGH